MLGHAMNKQVRPTHDYVACDVCGRTMLKGEQPDPYLAPSRERKMVCTLCAPRAQQEGWIRESGNPAAPVQPPRAQEGKRRFRRGRRATRAPAGGAEAGQNGSGESLAESGGDVAVANGVERSDPPAAGSIARVRRNPRHVRAVPTNSQLKLERAIALFNGSEHPRTVAGIARTLGAPRVCAVTSSDSTAEVGLTVAWELSWYRFVVDLSDTNDPVRVDARGQELDELDSNSQEWNATAEPDGTLNLIEPDGSDGAPPDEVL
jgi:hypothetical protein